MTRNGKIARLPRVVREQLNQRLDDGEPGKALVAWLNGLPEVVAVLARDFQGKGVTEQNLSEWKQGGFLDWQRHQEALECVRTAAEQAQELAAEAGPVPLTDVLSGSVALLLTKLIREVESGAERTPEARRELLALIREWTALRQGDHKAARLKMVQDDWDAARAKVVEAEAREAAEAARALAYANSSEGKIEAFNKKYEGVESEVIREVSKVMSKKALIDTVVGAARPEKAEWLREHIESRIKERQEELLAGFKQQCIDDLVAEYRGESDLIRPDPTSGVEEAENEEAVTEKASPEGEMECDTDDPTRPEGLPAEAADVKRRTRPRRAPKTASQRVA